MTGLFLILFCLFCLFCVLKFFQIIYKVLADKDIRNALFAIIGFFVFMGILYVVLMFLMFV